METNPEQLSQESSLAHEGLASGSGSWEGWTKDIMEKMLTVFAGRLDDRDEGEGGAESSKLRTGGAGGSVSLQSLTY